MTDDIVRSGEDIIRQIIESAVEIPSTDADLDSLQALAEQCKTDKGAPFVPQNVIQLASLKKNNQPEFEKLRGQFKEAGVRVGELDKAIEANHEDDDDSDERSATAVLIEIAGRGRFFQTSDGKAYAKEPVENHNEVWPIGSRGFRKWLTREFYVSEECLPKPAELESVLNLLEAQANFHGPEEKVFLRIAEQDGRIYVDLCNDKWQAVEIDAAGWRVIDNPPVNFRRASGMAALPNPTPGGSINKLREFVNLKDDDHFKLLVCVLLSYLRSRGPYPIIALIGEQGTAKSSTTRAIRNMVDPSTSLVRALPKELRDLAIAANNSHVLAFDNISGLSPQMSDALCRLSTGGGFSTRALYTDDEEVVFDAQRPDILNGIDDMIDRPDLADRSVFLELAPIPDEARRSESDMQEEFQEAWPAILGALLDGVTHGLKNLPTIRLSRLPRMADFAKWAAACETAYWPAGTFLNVYERNREQAVEDVLEADLVSHTLRKMLALRTERTVWTVTAAELLSKMENAVDDHVLRKRQWPGTPRALSGKLRRAAPFLKRIGIDIRFSREGHDRTRTIHISTDKSPK